MWMLKNSPALLMDLYELTMAQVYFEKGMRGEAYFETTIRTLPKNWAFFVMAGLAEMDSFLKEFRFDGEDIEYLRNTGKFSPEFLNHLKGFRPDVKIRSLSEGTVFFPGEPLFEVGGPILDAQILESYCLNILGFSIVEASLSARVRLAAKGVPLVDFGLRRAQGPVASLRAARGAQMAGFAATSNLLASSLLDFAPSGTMAHSFIEAYEDEEEALRDFALAYGEEAVLLVDTYDTVEGVKKACKIAREMKKDKGIEVKGVRIDSGDFVELTKYARKYFGENGVEYLKIFVSTDIDEYKIARLLEAGAQIDGFGVGTNLAVSREAPAVDIVYKLAEYAGKDTLKTSPGKATYPGRKTLLRERDGHFIKDVVRPYEKTSDDLLRPPGPVEDMETIKSRLRGQLEGLDESLKRIVEPAKYPVEFVF
jgi:nicotinate phosphoribosyltransferase